MEDLIEKVAALAELQKQATPGPWLLTTINANPRGLRNYKQVVRATDTGLLGGLPVPKTTMQLTFDGYGKMEEQSDGTPDGYWPTAETKANAQFIATAGSLDFAALHAALTAPAPSSSLLVGGPLDNLNDDLRFILGRPNFWCAPYAAALRTLGQEVRTKAEDEQAATIHWLLKAYLADPAKWRENIGAELKKAAELATVKGGQPNV